MKTITKLSLLSVLMLIFINVNAQQERKYIRKGNRSYAKAKIDSVTVDTTQYEKAEKNYRQALEESGNDWSASYNLANSLYKQAKYEDAVKQYQAVSGMDIENKENLAKAFHNLGNSLLLQNKLDLAIDAYKNSLRNNPSDYDTKYNLAWAQNKQKQQQQNKDQNKDKKDQDKNKKDNQDKDQKDKQKENQQNKDQQNQNQQPQKKQNKISKEDAMRILQALQNDEKDVQDKVQKQKGHPVKRNTEKDW